MPQHHNCGRDFDCIVVLSFSPAYVPSLAVNLIPSSISTKPATRLSMLTMINTTASWFACNKMSELCKEIHCLPLPREGYYYKGDGVVNLLSLVFVSKKHRVYMDTNINNAFYVYNKNGTYIHSGLCKNISLYSLDIGTNRLELSLSHTTIRK